MKIIVAILLFGIGLSALVRAQAPASLGGLTLYVNYTNNQEAFDNPNQQVIDFLANGTFRLRVATIQRGLYPTQTDYQSPTNGSYQYVQTSPTTATITLTPMVISSVLSVMTFSSNAQGTIRPAFAEQTGLAQFGLVSTGGVPMQRAMINLSFLATVNQGKSTTVGFVIGGTAAFREVLIRAVGPSLSKFGITDFAPNPNYRITPQVRTPNYNIDWSQDPIAATTLAAEGSRAGAFPLVQGSHDKADIYLLPSGSYTITVTPAAADQEGQELVEVYEIQ